MLYDPKWETKTDPLTLDGVVTWLEKQPAETAYCYQDGGTCLLSQYLIATGCSDIWVGGYTLKYTTRGGIQIHDEIELWADRVVLPRPRTFGAAIARAKAIRDAH